MQFLFLPVFRVEYQASTFLTCISSFKSLWISSFGICKLSAPSLPSENKTVGPAMAHPGLQEPVWMCSFNSLFGEIGHYHGEFMLLVLTKATNQNSIFLQRDILASTSPSWAHCLCQISSQFLIPFLNKNITHWLKMNTLVCFGPSFDHIVVKLLTPPSNRNCSYLVLKLFPECPIHQANSSSRGTIHW